MNSWVRNLRRDHEDLVAGLAGSDVIVNAAGVAEPASRDLPRLVSGNAALPAALASLARDLGVPRIVHLSTSAVQGHRPVLDETDERQPTSPYSWSKTLAEELLLENDLGTPAQVVIYRPTSVQGRDRRITGQLVALARRRILPLSRGGDVPLPVALVQNVGAAAVHLATAAAAPRIALHPWEGMTARDLLAAFGGRAARFDLPPAAARPTVALLRAAGRYSSHSLSWSTRLGLLWMGQRQDAKALVESGFVCPVGRAGYAELGRLVAADTS